jgi:hypothetical protein
MTTTTQLKATAAAPGVALEARAREDGVLDADGFFTQDDWEFELDTMQDQSRSALAAHVAKGPVDHETAVFLKGYLMNSRELKFTPFAD